MTPTEQKAFDALREALEEAQRDINWMLNTRKFLNGFVFNYIDTALTAAASVSHPKPETAPLSEGGAITSESVLALLVKEMRYIATITNGQAHRIAMMTLEKVAAANAVSEHVPEVGFGNIVGTYGKVVEWPSLTEQPQATEPAGYKLVPVEPTQEMLDAVVTTLDDHLLGPDAEKQYREDWAAMLAAAPEQKQ